MNSWAIFRGEFNSIALAVSADGSVVVGNRLFTYGGWEHAVFWSEDNEWEKIFLNDFLDSVGIDRNGFGLREAYAISSDGTTIVGSGVHLGGNREAYRIRIVETWAGYPIADEAGNVDTAPWMGQLCVENAPWVWCYDTNSWLYMTEECVEEGQGWIYATDVAGMQINGVGSSLWVWSNRLSRWIVLPHDTFNNGQGWVYVPAY